MLIRENRVVVSHTSFVTMTSMNLTGRAISRARMMLDVFPTFFLFCFNQSNIGGVLGYPSFIKYFSTINKATTTGSAKAQNAKVQGQLAL